MCYAISVCEPELKLSFSFSSTGLHFLTFYVALFIEVRDNNLNKYIVQH